MIFMDVTLIYTLLSALAKICDGEKVTLLGIFGLHWIRK
jgi:hypothetical protein